MSRRNNYYSQNTKASVLKDYASGILSISEIVSKYGLANRQIIYKWLDKSLYQKKSLSLHSESQNNELMDKYDKMDADALRQRLKEVEADLKQAQLQNLALNTLIDIAEEQGIKIRKKSGAKQ